MISLAGKSVRGTQEQYTNNVSFMLKSGTVAMQSQWLHTVGTAVVTAVATLGVSQEAGQLTTVWPIQGNALYPVDLCCTLML